MSVTSIRWHLSTKNISRVTPCKSERDRNYARPKVQNKASCNDWRVKFYTDLEHHQLTESVPAASEAVCAIICYRAGSNDCKMFSYINGTCSKYGNITGNITRTPSASNTPVHVRPIYVVDNTNVTTTTTTTIDAYNKIECTSPWLTSVDGLSCYGMVINVQSSWREARKTCEQAHTGSDLASIRHQQDMDRMISKTGGKSFHIGLNSLQVAGKWTWTDGSEPTYTHWNPNYGAVVPDSHVYVMSYGEDPNRGWKSTSELNTNFACEYFLNG